MNVTPARRLVLLLASAIGAACGGDATPIGAADAGTLDGATDATVKDAAGDAPIGDSAVGNADPTLITNNSISCGNDTCNTFSGTVCCVAPPGGLPPFCTIGSCHPTDDAYACDGPEDCSGYDQCCAPEPLNGAPGGRSARCVGDCPFPQRSTLCHRDADCVPEGTVCCFHGSGYPAAGDCRTKC